MFFEIFVFFQKKNLNLCVFSISDTCLHVISYKCEYVSFHLNMLKIISRNYHVFFFFLD
jgi:hypothetical protein